MDNKLSRNIQKLRLAKNLLAGAGGFAAWEFKHNRLIPDIKALVQKEPNDISWAELLAECAADSPNKVFLRYNEEEFSYWRMNRNANKASNFLLASGGAKCRGVGLFLRNSPRFLEVFFGAQKAGMYVVTINPELRGDGLAYIINHSDIEQLVIDAELIDAVKAVADQLERVALSDIIVDDIEPEAEGYKIPPDMKCLSDAGNMSAEPPDMRPDPDDLCLIIYTSGTTGPPKGVVYRYNTTGVNQLRFVGHFLLKKNDVYYVYLSLTHGNALFISTTATMAARATMGLSRKFSASRFWDNVRFYNATIFNTIGSIIPILMKQPENPTDLDNNVRVVFSAACPSDMWEPFENRFGVTIYEGYGAIDGGGKGVLNFGTAPKGSLGKPTSPGGVKLIDEKGCEAPPGIPGELIFKVGNKGSSVEYYKNEEASQKKVRDGWLYTGDILKRDKKGFFYFVGRNTESMRKGGENVSAYEVEHVIMKHPAVEEVAVYAVPSEMIEDEIMAAVKVVDGRTLDPDELRRFLSDKLARYAVPRYIRFVDEFPKTNTHRIIKAPLEKEGITEYTDDAAKDKREMAHT
ncbi:MAG: AMP-binding protein [Thermodesulfobacteriota bacterium]|nr:AMP-binding protein [Thermodesulfobacteriota bacterium]